MGRIKKKEFDFKKMKQKFSSEATFKDDEFFDLGPAFTEACGITGPAKGHINMFIGHTDTGKAQPLSSNILTPNGWKKMGDISLGDEIVGSDGKIQYVIGIYPQGKRKVYNVKISDGSSVKCDIEHLWSVNTHKQRTQKKYNKKGKRIYFPDNSFKTISLKEMIDDVKVGSEQRKNFKLPNLSPVSFNSIKDLPIDSYTLGCFIGDGSFGSGNSLSVISTKDNEIINEISSTIHCRKVNDAKREFETNDGLTVVRSLNTIVLTNETKHILRKLGLIGHAHKKFIPNDYKLASINDRISLLQGIMDTDGYVDKRSGTAYLSTSSEKLAYDVIDIVNSLGGLTNLNTKIPKYTYKGKTKIGKKAYIITVKLNKIKPFRLSRKLDLYKDNSNISKFIESINFSHEEECQCIKVSNSDELYVTDNYVLTHNTTAMLKTAIDAQKKGILPVFIITEQKWSFKHAQLMGFECESSVDEETGEIIWDGFYLFNNEFLYIEQITDYINNLLDEQMKGEIPFELLFLWDSVGSVPCKMTYEGKGGKQHNASALADKIGMGINQRITGSRRKNSQYTNTLLIVNQPWVELPDGFGQPKIKAKGGESIWLNSTLVFRFGNEKNSGISKINAIRNKRKVNFATRTKVSIMKNHVNGVGYDDGKIMVTAHGFLPARDSDEEKISKELYLREKIDYISKLFGEVITDVTDIVISDDNENSEKTIQQLIQDE
jgi:hypothetical protein